MLGRSIAFFFISAAVFTMLLSLIECNVFSKLWHQISRRFERSIPPLDYSNMDDDVREEKQKVDAMTPNDLELNNLVIKNLSKVYRQFLAVNQLSLAVKRYVHQFICVYSETININLICF